MKKLIAFLSGALIAAVIVFSFYDKISAAIKKPTEENNQTEQTETVAGSHVSDSLRVGSDTESVGHYLKTGANVSITTIRQKVKRDDDASIAENTPKAVIKGRSSSGAVLTFGKKSESAYQLIRNLGDNSGTGYNAVYLRIKFKFYAYDSFGREYTEIAAVNLDVPKAKVAQQSSSAVLSYSTSGSSSNMTVEFTVSDSANAEIRISKETYENLTSGDVEYYRIYGVNAGTQGSSPKIAEYGGDVLLDYVNYCYADPNNGGSFRTDTTDYIPYAYGNETRFAFKDIETENVTLTLSDVEKKHTYSKAAVAVYDGADIVLTLKDTAAFEFVGFNETAFLCSYSSSKHGTWADNHVPLSNEISNVTYTVQSWTQRFVRTGAYVELINNYSGARKTYITALTKPDVGRIPIHFEDTDEELKEFLHPYNPEKEMLVVSFMQEPVPRERYGDTDIFHTEYAVPEHSYSDTNYTLTVQINKTKRPVKEQSGFWAGVGGFFGDLWDGTKSFFGGVWSGTKKVFGKVGDFFFGDDGVVDTVKGVFSGIGSGFSYFGIILIIGVIVLALVIVVPLFRRR